MEGQNFEKIEKSKLPGYLIEMRNIARYIIENSEDEKERLIASKIIEKINLKQTDIGLFKHSDDITQYNEVKKLGIFIVIDKISEIGLHLPELDVEISKGDRILDLHIPPNDGTAGLLSKTRKSFKMLSEYIKFHNIDAKYVIGVTYEEIAKLAPLFGFKIDEVNLPDSLKQNVETLFNESSPLAKKGKQVGSIMFVHQKTQDFLKKYK